MLCRIMRRQAAHCRVYRTACAVGLTLFSPREFSKLHGAPRKQMRVDILLLILGEPVHGFVRLAGRKLAAPCAGETTPVSYRLARSSRLPATREEAPQSSHAADGGLIVGLNKYSHDSSVCLIKYEDGSCIFAGEKERLTRRKHDGGHTAELMDHALTSVGASLEDVRLVVSNNHHHRVAPFERRIPWAVAMGTYPESYNSPENLLPDASHAELSHHLAHAWSAAALAPFDSGLIVVMDGMGESHAAMAKSDAVALAQAAEVEEAKRGESREARQQGEYYNDMRLMRELGADGEMARDAGVPGEGNPGFQQIPENILGHEAYREAESAYTFLRGEDGGPPTITPVYKRWTVERSPPELYNHGFENMESLGAVYSRISSHIFGDWNACGKVMGLAPWAGKWTSKEGSPPPRLTSGSLLSKGTEGHPFRVHWEAIDQLPRPNELGDQALRPYYASLAATAQEGLEDAAMDFISGLRNRTGEKNLCLCGGVALNSVLNGKVAREGGFERTFVPPYPGDEGVAVGCAAFGWHQRWLLFPREKDSPSDTSVSTGTRDEPCKASGTTGDDGRENERCEGSPRFDEHGERERKELESTLPAPFWGKSWSPEEMSDELDEWEPWLDVRQLEDVEEVAQAIADGEVVAWFQGRGEFGPRALGNRCLLADPRDPDMPSRINRDVKKREDFRPFAPSVLAGEAGHWFDGLPHDGSPYMSLTAPARTGVAEKVPAVCHVDGSSRLQTVREEDNPLYHRLIAAFFSLTEVPMVLNTSFNVMGEPIVDSPEDAIRALMSSSGAIGMLVLGDKVVTLRPFPPDAEEADDGQVREGDDDEEGNGDPWDALKPFQARSFRSEVTSADSGEPDDGRDQWVELDAFQLEVLELVDGSLSLSELVEEVIEEKLSEEGDEESWLEANGDADAEEELERDATTSEEQFEGGPAEAIAGDVLDALRVLYNKGLVGFD